MLYEQLRYPHGASLHRAQCFTSLTKDTTLWLAQAPCGGTLELLTHVPGAELHKLTVTDSKSLFWMLLSYTLYHLLVL